MTESLGGEEILTELLTLDIQRQRAQLTCVINIAHARILVKPYTVIKPKRFFDT